MPTEENPVVSLCVQGMQAEFQGELDRARDLFQQAWEARRNDYEACVAAHYLARHQDTPQATLDWNLQALRAAAAAEAAEAAHAARAAEAGGTHEQEESSLPPLRGFYPSLYLNIGWSYEQLGDYHQAERYYNLAAERLDDLPPGAYRETIAGGLAAGKSRLSEAGG